MADGLLELRVRIPPEAWVFVCCECCVLSNTDLCDGPITRDRNPTECVSLCMIKGNNDPLHQQWVRQNDVGLYKINYIGLTIYI